MILNNEIDRIRFIRELLSAELPVMIEIFKDKGEGYWESSGGLYRAPTGYPDTPEPTLGPHTSGFREDCCE